MGALIVGYIIGSIVAIPFLTYHLLRTRRDLNALRAELTARGVIAPKSEHTHLPRAHQDDHVRPLAGGLDAASAGDDVR